MGFLDKAKAAADQLAAKADSAMASSGLGGPGFSTEKLFRDLGVITYLEATGRQAPEGERERVMGTLQQAEQQGAIPSFVLQTAPPPPASVPPPPGAAAQQGQQPPPMAPPPPQTTPPPPAPAAGTPAPTTTPPSAPPPPPPSWAKTDDA